MRKSCKANAPGVFERSSTISDLPCASKFMAQQMFPCMNACQSSLSPGCADRGYSPASPETKKAARTSEWRRLKLAKPLSLLPTVRRKLTASRSRAVKASRPHLNRQSIRKKPAPTERRTSPRAIAGRGKVKHSKERVVSAPSC